MTGIDKICEKILSDAQAQAQKITDRASAEAAEIRQSYSALAREESEQILEKGKKSAAERGERLAGVARLDARNLHLKTKQEMISKAFDSALEKLLTLPEDEYISTLATLAADSAITGKEQIILSERDRANYGKQVVSEANRILKSRRSQQDEPASIVKLGKALLTHLESGLTLSEETRNISGGVILSQDKMEINCAFETLIRLSRDEMSAKVADILFN